MRTFQDIEADTAKLVDIWVEDLGKKADLGRCHGIVVREEQLQLECATYNRPVSSARQPRRTQHHAPW